LTSRHKLLVGMSVFVLAQLNCADPKATKPEIVMTPGMIISAKTSYGSIKIQALKGYRRSYEWGGCKKEITLQVREERWLGQKGLFYPAPGLTWLWGCEGIHRASLEESMLDFGSESEFHDWVNAYKGMAYVYRNDGLMVAFRTRGELLIVAVHQVLIAGQKPLSLEGGTDDAISVDMLPPEVVHRN